MSSKISLKKNTLASSNHSNYYLTTVGKQEYFKMEKIKNDPRNIQDIIVKEENFEQTNSLSSLKTFFSKTSLYLIILMFIFFILTHSTKLAADLWLSFWFRYKYNISKTQYTYIYSILFLSSLVVFFFAFLFYSFMSIKGKKKNSFSVLFY